VPKTLNWKRAKELGIGADIFIARGQAHGFLTGHLGSTFAWLIVHGGMASAAGTTTIAA